MFDIIDNTVLRKYTGNAAIVIVPEGTETIGEAAFEENNALEEVILPESVQTICSSAFERCHALRKVKLPASLKTIDDDAFVDCEVLHFVEIPGKAAVAHDAFSGVPLERAILLPRTDGNKNILSPELRLAARLCPFCEDGHLLISADGNMYRCDHCGNSLSEEEFRESMSYQIRNGILYRGWGTGDTSIPEGVRKISTHAFDDTGIQHCYIPDSVTEIGVSAFFWCSSLNYVFLPSNLKRIEEECFCATDSLRKIELPDALVFIGRAAFANSGIRSIKFNYNLKVISRDAFKCAKNLKVAMFPHGVEILDRKAFWGCTSLEAVIVPGSIACIEDDAFGGCFSMHQAIIKDGVQQIGDRTFANCIALRRITLPDSIIAIGRDAFAGCDSLQEAEIPLHLKDSCEGVFPAHTQIRYRDDRPHTLTDTMILLLKRDAWLRENGLITEIEKRADNGDVTAMVYMGDCCRLGRYVQESDTKARAWYERAAQKGDIRARGYLLSYSFSYLSIDHLREITWLMRAGSEVAIREYAAYINEDSD